MYTMLSMKILQLSPAAPSTLSKGQQCAALYQRASNFRHSKLLLCKAQPSLQERDGCTATPCRPFFCNSPAVVYLAVSCYLGACLAATVCCPALPTALVNIASSNPACKRAAGCVNLREANKQAGTRRRAAPYST